MSANPEPDINNDCLTPLMKAACAGDADIVKILISHGQNVNTQSKLGIA